MTDNQKNLFAEIQRQSNLCKAEKIYPIGMELRGPQKRTAKILQEMGLVELFSGGFNGKYTYAKINQSHE
jgi:hypothetical protein